MERREFYVSGNSKAIWSITLHDDHRVTVSEGEIGPLRLISDDRFDRQEAQIHYTALIDEKIRLGYIEASWSPGTTDLLLDAVDQARKLYPGGWATLLIRQADQAGPKIAAIFNTLIEAGKRPELLAGEENLKIANDWLNANPLITTIGLTPVARKSASVEGRVAKEKLLELIEKGFLAEVERAKSSLAGKDAMWLENNILSTATKSVASDATKQVKFPTSSIELCKSFQALYKHSQHFTDMNSFDEPEFKTAVEVAEGTLDFVLNIEIVQVTNEVQENYFYYNTFCHGQLVFEFADKEAKVWQTRFPLFGWFFYDYVKKNAKTFTLWKEAPKKVQEAFANGLFLETDPWGCGSFEGEYWRVKAKISKQIYGLSTEGIYAKLQIAWWPEKGTFIVRQKDWGFAERYDEDNLMSPFYFEVPWTEVCPLQSKTFGITFTATDKTGTAQPGVSVIQTRL